MSEDEQAGYRKAVISYVDILGLQSSSHGVLAALSRSRK